jgi:hypothetical protein
MRPFEHRSVLILIIAFGTAAVAATEPAPQRYSAPITIVQGAPFVQVDLPVAAYAHSMQADLRDLRVVDSRGERVPFALLTPPPAPAVSERLRDATLYPLPPRPPGGGVWRSPVDVTVDGDRISVHRSGTVAAGPNPFPGPSPGWLLDLGEARPGDLPPRRLRLAWSGPAEFSAAYALESSDDLRSWRGAGGGQVMALRSATDILTQPLVPLPSGTGRFVRLVWLDPASAPVLTGAAALAPAPGMVPGTASSELNVAPSAEPAGPFGPDALTKRALHFDLGGDLPLVDLEVRFFGGTHVAPVRMQGRSSVDERWHELGSGVFYRLERDGAATESPAIVMQGHARFIRVIVDERGAPLDSQTTRLTLHTRLATLVFATAGQAPFRLLAGSPDASDGALPVATLVPRLDEERQRFGRATLGAFVEDPEVARAAVRAAGVARLRPWLLWGVLIVGVAVLAALVWRLAGGAAPPPKTPSA